MFFLNTSVGKINCWKQKYFFTGVSLCELNDFAASDRVRTTTLTFSEVSIAGLEDLVLISCFSIAYEVEDNLLIRGNCS